MGVQHCNGVGGVELHRPISNNNPVWGPQFISICLDDVSFNPLCYVFKLEAEQWQGLLACHMVKHKVYGLTLRKLHMGLSP